MAWMIWLRSGVSDLNDNMIGILEEKVAADYAAPVLLALYNNQFPEYSHYELTEVRDGPYRN